MISTWYRKTEPARMKPFLMEPQTDWGWEIESGRVHAGVSAARSDMCTRLSACVCVYVCVYSRSFNTLVHRNREEREKISYHDLRRVGVLESSSSPAGGWCRRREWDRGEGVRWTTGEGVQLAHPPAFPTPLRKSLDSMQCYIKEPFGKQNACFWGVVQLLCYSSWVFHLHK